jgi:hypothetical protein
MQDEKLRRTLDDMRRNIVRDIASGFSSPDEIVQGAVEVFSDQHDADLLRSHAERITREVLAQHLGAQVQWPDVTDCDLLDSAFAELDQAGVVARQNFSCCPT